MRSGKQQGFAYLAVLAMVAVASIMAHQLSGDWSVRMSREKEAELLFNGNQIARAIEHYYQSGPVRGCYPPNLEALLEDRRNFRAVRHLRKMYRDPLAAGDGEGEGWGILEDGAGRIAGVYSQGKGTPFKQRDFPPGYANFEGKSRYADWKFVALPGSLKPASPGLCAK